MDYSNHNALMVAHFLWLEAHAPKGYARDAVAAYQAHPDSPNPNILADVKAEKARRATETQPTPEKNP